MIRHFLAGLIALLLPVSAMADGAFWTGGVFGGAGSGGVSSSADLSLDVGTKLCWDADATNNDCIYSSADGTMRIAPGGTIISTLTTASWRLTNDILNQYGSSGEFSQVYDSGNLQFELNSTDCGGATPCTLLAIDRGDGIFDLRNDEFFHNETDGAITFGGAGGTNNEDLVLDFETAANTITATSSTGANLFNFSGISLITPSIYTQLYNAPAGITVGGFEFDATQDDVLFTNSATYGNQWIFGPGASRAKDFDHVPQTNPTLYVHSDTDPDSDNTQWLSLSHDVTQGRIETGTGKIALGGVGLTNNEDLVLDFETSSNRVEVSSNTGMTLVDFNAIGLIAGSVFANSQTSSSGISAAGITYTSSFAQTLMTGSATYGNQWIIAPGASASKDFDHVSQTNPTLYVHSDTDPDSDNTQWLSLAHDQTDGVIAVGSGNVKVDSPLLKNSAELSHFVSIDADSTPYTVLATDLGIVCDPDTGGTPGDVTISLPASAGAGRRIFVKNVGTTYDCLVDPNGTEQIDAGGAGTASTVDTKASLTIKDVGVSTFEWVIE